LTTFFFIFSLVYCCAHCILQSLVFSLDNEYATLVSRIVKAGNLPPRNFTFLQGHSGHLQLQICNDIPHGGIHPCTTIYDSIGRPVQPVQPLVLEGWQKGLDVTSFFNATLTGVQIKTLDGQAFNLSEQCVGILTFPYQTLMSFTSEDITSLCLQVWLVIVSFLVLLNDSVPHTLAALMTRALEAGWAMYATWRGPYFQANFQELTTSPGSQCSLDLFSAYWRKRHVFEISELALSTTGLIIFSYLSWKLLKVYNAQSFKCVGAPQHVMRIHKFFMAVLACLQLEVFVLVISLGLWSKTLTETTMAHISEHTPVYKALYIGTIVLLLPWIAMGWYSIRREMKRMMIVFIGIAFIFTAGWSIMFYSIIYRWTFTQWPYLSCYTIASFILLIASMILGIICRMNFGKGLAQYLHAEAALSSLNFSPDSFSHDTTTVRTSSSRKMDVHRSIDLDMKILDLKDQYDSPLYFLSLTKGESGR